MSHIKIYEEDIENYLSNPKNLKSKLDLEFIARQVEIPPLGRIDILAYSKRSEKFVIIEIKKDLLDQKALLQGLRYKNYYNSTYNKIDWNPCSKKKKFSLLLIGQDLDESLAGIVKHYDQDYMMYQRNVYYTLFNQKFGLEPEFNYCSTSQQDLESELRKIEEEKYQYL
jgi:hypothetical protein